MIVELPEDICTSCKHPRKDHRVPGWYGRRSCVHPYEGNDVLAHGSFYCGCSWFTPVSEEQNHLVPEVRTAANEWIVRNIK